MKITLKPAGSALVISIEGEISAFNFIHSERHDGFGTLNDFFRNVFASEVKEKGVRTIIFDLQRVPYIESSGINAMLNIYRDMKSVGGRVVFAALHETVHRIFSILKIDSVFDVYPNVDEAVTGETAEAS